MRHPALPPGQPYGNIIESHRLENQSVNSHNLNSKGDPRDVLFDTKHGRHYASSQIARFAASDILQLEIPIDKIIRMKKGVPVTETVTFRFEIAHEPTPCMYPHCVIFALQDGSKVERIKAETVKTALRSEFARLAEANRLEMLAFVNIGLPREKGFFESCRMLLATALGAFQKWWTS